MKFLNIFIFSFIIAFVCLYISAPSAFAVAYDLIAPTDTLTRGQNVQFIVNIDTQSTSVKTQTVGMTYEKQYLQYVSITPGDAMTSVTVQSGDGTLLLNATNTTGFNGSGVFAYVTFKIIAQAPGTTELCALFQPSTTPTNTPPPVTIAPVVPTQLPKTGNNVSTLPIGAVGTVMIVVSAGVFIALKKWI